jgi:hypothetical protein
MDLKVSLPHIVKQYNLNTKAGGGFVHLETHRTIYELSKAGILANTQLCEKAISCRLL